jgi:hypothetical protein
VGYYQKKGPLPEEKEKGGLVSREYPTVQGIVKFDHQIFVKCTYKLTRAGFTPRASTDSFIPLTLS